MTISKIRDKTPTYCLLLVLLLATIYCISEIFVLCNDFSLLSIHGIDDAAFAESLRKLYASQNLTELMVQNEYGYGWIYWSSVALFALPGKILFDLTGIATLYIILPRSYSLLFSLLSVFVFYKLCKIYIKNSWLAVCATLLFPLYPTLMYFSQRFGTTSVLAFFSISCVYFMVRDEEITRRSFYLSCGCLAIALAIKLTAAAIVPLFLMLLFSRFHFCFSKDHWKLWLKTGAISIYGCLFCISPAIALAPLFPKESGDSLAKLLYFISASAGKNLQFIENMICGVINGTWFSVCYICLLVLMLLSVLNKWKSADARKWDWLCFVIGYGVGMIFICYTATNGSNYAVNYGTILSYLPLLGLAWFDGGRSKKRSCYITVFCLLALQCGFLAWQVFQGEEISVHHFSQVEATTREKAERSLELKALVQTCAEKENLTQFSILADASIPTFYSKIQNESTTFDSIWSNLQEWNVDGKNFIVLDKIDDSRLWYLSQEQRTDGSLAEDDAARAELIETGVLQGIFWDLIQETDEYYFFARAQGQ